METMVKQQFICRWFYAAIAAASPSANHRASRFFLAEEGDILWTHANHPKRNTRGMLACKWSIDILGVRKNAGAGAPNCFLRKAYCDFAC